MSTLFEYHYRYSQAWETESNIFFSGEICDEEVGSYMDGAIRSGEGVPGNFSSVNPRLIFKI